MEVDFLTYDWRAKRKNVVIFKPIPGQRCSSCSRDCIGVDPKGFVLYWCDPFFYNFLKVPAVFCGIECSVHFHIAINKGIRPCSSTSI